MAKPLLRRAWNRLLHTLARFLPGSFSLRPGLHRARGVKIGRNVFIGDDVYLDNEFPEAVTIGDGVQISVRAIILAHTRGPGSVLIEDGAFVGPSAILICGAGRTLTIGAGAVVSAGCVVTRNVAPGVVVVPAPFRPMARAGVPLTSADTMEQFCAGLTPMDAPPS